MKKILFIITLFYISLSSNVNAQCTPDGSVTTPGISPLGGAVIAAGTIGSAYAQTFTIVVPADTMIGTFTLAINDATVTGVTGMPAGLTYTCAPTACVFPGGGTDCFIIDGTPSEVGTFTVVVAIEIDISSVGVVPLPDNSYTLVVADDPTGINTVGGTTFEVFPVTPNPSSDQAEIRFTVSSYRDVSFSVHNMIGAVLISKKIYAEKGLNIVSLNAEELNPGVYFVTLTDGTNTSTKRMVVGSR